MPPKLWVSLAGLVIAAASLAASRAADLQIEHVTIVSPERDGPMRDARVRVHAGRIVSISKAGVKATAPTKGMTTIDGTGLFLSPGLIDSHVHLGAVPGMTPEHEAAHPDIVKAAQDQIPRSYVLSGFTSLIDLISTPQEMARWKGHGTVPDTYFCGGAALMDGYPMNYVPKPQRYQAAPYMLIESGSQAPAGIDPALHTPQAVISRMKADGAICVKTFFERGFGGVTDLPVPKVETIRALVKAAHAAGMPVLMHANSEEAQKFGLDAGVDILAHGLWNWGQEQSKSSELTPGIKKLLDQEIAHNVGWQPTMQVLHGLTDLFSTSFLSDPRLARVLPANLIDWYRSPEGQWFRAEMSQESNGSGNSPAELERTVNQNFFTVIDRGKQTTAYMIARGGRVLFGSDTPSSPTYANPPGLNEWLEMQWLKAAGETAAQIFRSATLTNARALKLDRDIGTVQVGRRANLLLLQRDPTQSIEAYSGIVKVILNGRVLDPKELAANTAH
jgi:imidazolonepropionase-like amidohydrolase